MPVSLRGDVHIERYDGSGHMQEVRDIRNLAMTVGKQIINDKLRSVLTLSGLPFGITWLGSDSSAPAAGDGGVKSPIVVNKTTTLTFSSDIQANLRTAGSGATHAARLNDANTATYLYSTISGFEPPAEVLTDLYHTSDPPGSTFHVLKTVSANYNVVAQKVSGVGFVAGSWSHRLYIPGVATGPQTVDVFSVSDTTPYEITSLTGLSATVSEMALGIAGSSVAGQPGLNRATFSPVTLQPTDTLSVRATISFVEV